MGYQRLLPFVAISAVALCGTACGGRSTPVSTLPAATPANTTTATIGDSTFAIANSDSIGPSLAAKDTRVVLTWAATTDKGATNIFAVVSGDGGLTFGSPVRVNDIDGDAHVNGEAPPRVALGRDIAIAWPSKHGDRSRIRMARSIDGGRTFLPAMTLHSETLTGARGWESIAVGPDELIHALWLDGRHASAMAGHSHMHADEPTTKAAGDGDDDGDESMEQDVIASTWNGADRVSETQIASNVCFCCKTATAVGPDHVVYAAWRHVYPKSMRDMAVARSDDGGRTFSAPTRVSEDHWQLTGCPDDGPTMVVDATNVIHIAWPTLVPGPKPQKGIFYAFSVDGGRTFSARLRIDDQANANASHPQIALDGHDVVVVWDNLAQGKRRVEARRVSLSGNGATRTATLGGSGPASLDSGGPAFYPAIATSVLATLVAWVDGADHTTIHLRGITR